MIGATRSAELAPLTPSFACGLRRARARLVMRLRKRESRAYGNQIGDGVRDVGRQAQPMKSFPSASANSRWILIRAFFGQFLAPSLLTFAFFPRKALRGCPDEVACGRQGRACEGVTSLRTAYARA